MLELKFTLPEILSLLGMAQCVFLIVHIILRGHSLSSITLPVIFFIVLGGAFWADAAYSQLLTWQSGIYYTQWGGWFLIPPLSVMLVMQIAAGDKMPAIKDFWILFLIPFSFIVSALSIDGMGTNCSLTSPCPEFKDVLRVTGLMAGTISLLVIFSRKDMLDKLRRQKSGAERYWLVLALIVLNALFLGSVFLALAHFISDSERILLRTIFGLGFVYIISTSLLRLFPVSGRGSSSQSGGDSLSEEELALALRIESLLDLEKVYHEPTYSRSDLARECEVSEVMVSKVINTYFKKSFPQIMNERRIEDAKRLLVETDAAVKTVSEEVGFNSLPSFNRVFKDMTATAPGDYRKQNKP